MIGLILIIDMVGSIILPLALLYLAINKHKRKNFYKDLMALCAFAFVVTIAKTIINPSPFNIVMLILWIAVGVLSLMRVRRKSQFDEMKGAKYEVINADSIAVAFENISKKIEGQKSSHMNFVVFKRYRGESHGIDDNEAVQLLEDLKAKYPESTLHIIGLGFLSRRKEFIYTVKKA